MTKSISTFGEFLELHKFSELKTAGCKRAENSLLQASREFMEVSPAGDLLLTHPAVVLRVWARDACVMASIGLARPVLMPKWEQSEGFAWYVEKGSP